MLLISRQLVERILDDARITTKESLELRHEISRQLVETILDDARITTKESLELRHECRHTMCISRILRYVAQKERTSLASSLPTFESKQSAEGHGVNNSPDQQTGLLLAHQ